MIAECVVSVTGKPSANKTLAVAKILDVHVRRQDALAYLQSGSQSGSRNHPASGSGNRFPSGSGNHLSTGSHDTAEVVPGTGSQVVPEEKESSKEKEASLTIPPTPNGVVAPKGRARQAVPEVEFEPDDERRVAAILAVEASANQSNALALSKVQSIRFQLRSLLDEIGSASWRYGLDEALSRAKPVAYAVAVAKSSAKAPKNVILFSSRTFTDERPADDTVAAAVAKASRK